MSSDSSDDSEWDDDDHVHVFNGEAYYHDHENGADGHEHSEADHAQALATLIAQKDGVDKEAVAQSMASFGVTLEQQKVQEERDLQRLEARRKKASAIGSSAGACWVTASRTAWRLTLGKPLAT